MSTHADERGRYPVILSPHIPWWWVALVLSCFLPALCTLVRRSVATARLMCGGTATLAHMTIIAARDLRNHTAEVLRQVQAGTVVTVAVRGVPVAEITSLSSQRRTSIPKAELVQILTHHQADAGLRTDLARLAGETTNDLGPVR